MPERETMHAWIQQLLGPRRPIPPAPPVEQPLIRCPRCRADRVVPIEWRERGLDAWWMALRCGECGAARDLIASDDEAERFGHDLDDGIAELAADLRRLERDRMANDVAALVAAIERDLIDAGDFER